MSGLDLPPLHGFQRSPLDGLSLRQLQDPERLGRLPDGAQGEPQGEVPATPFEGLLADSIGKVADLQRDTQEKTRGLALGEDVEVHDVLIAAGKSEVAFNLLLEVRNKLVDAWEKLSRSAV